MTAVKHAKRDGAARPSKARASRERRWRVAASTSFQRAQVREQALRSAGVSEAKTSVRISSGRSCVWSRAGGGGANEEEAPPVVGGAGICGGAMERRGGGGEGVEEDLEEGDWPMLRGCPREAWGGAGHAGGRDGREDGSGGCGGEETMRRVGFVCSEWEENGESILRQGNRERCVLQVPS